MTSAIAAGLVRLVARTRINFGLLGSFRLTPGVSEEVPAVSRSSTSVHVGVQVPALTGTDTHKTLLAPYPQEPRVNDTPLEIIAPANGEPSEHPEADAVLMTLARLLGRQIAREQFLMAQAAANAPADNGET